MPVDFDLAQAGYNCEVKSIDKDQIYQLDIWYSNDYDLYRIYYAWIKNYARKMKGGRYDKKLAIKGIANNYVPMIIRHYKKQNEPETYKRHLEQEQSYSVLTSYHSQPWLLQIEHNI